MKICTQCQDYGRPAKKKRGSDGVAIAAWFVFPLGLPYTAWRALSKVSVCRYCGSRQLVDSESMVGQRLMSKIIGEAVDDEDSPIAAAAPPMLASTQGSDVASDDATFVDDRQMDLLSSNMRAQETAAETTQEAARDIVDDSIQKEGAQEEAIEPARATQKAEANDISATPAQTSKRKDPDIW